jgi:hypothetical protein
MQLDANYAGNFGDTKVHFSHSGKGLIRRIDRCGDIVMLRQKWQLRDVLRRCSDSK